MSSYTAALRQLKANDDKAFAQALDAQMKEQQKLHVAALDESLARHTAVRREAELTLEQYQLEERRKQLLLEEEQKRRVAESQKRLLEEQEAQRRRDAFREQQQLEAQRRIEAERRQEQLAREEKARRDAETRAKDDADRKAREEAAALKAQQQQEAKKAQQAAQKSADAAALLASKTSQAATPVPSVPQQDQGVMSSTSSERLALHRQYLDLHIRLKEMRKSVLDGCKNGPVKGLKNQVSDWRRAIGKCCGQLSVVNKDGNRRAMREIEAILDAAGQVAGQPMVDPSLYVIQTGGQSLDGPVSGLMIYLLNILVKKIVAQLGYEAAINPAIADPIGVMALTVFASPKYQINGVAFMDLMWAKYHRACPVLFGITAPESTNAGRKLLGWAQEDDDRTGNKIWVKAEAHYGRMRGLAAGYAAFTLRDFSKSAKKNPVPNRLYWEAIARIVNTPPQHQIASQYAVLKALIDVTFIPRFINFFGRAAFAAMHTAFIEFPKTATAQARANLDFNGCVKSVESMPMILDRDLHLCL